MAESPEGVAIQIYSALIAALMLQLLTGKRPGKRAMELIRFHMMGYAGSGKKCGHSTPDYPQSSEHAEQFRPGVDFSSRRELLHEELRMFVFQGEIPVQEPSGSAGHGGVGDKRETSDRNGRTPTPLWPVLGSHGRKRDSKILLFC